MSLLNSVVVFYMASIVRGPMALTNKQTNDQLVEDVRELIRMGPDNKEAVEALADKKGECEDAVEKMQYYVDTMRLNFYRKLDEMGFKPSWAESSA